jgi:hypothetical protein
MTKLELIEDNQDNIGQSQAQHLSIRSITQRIFDFLTKPTDLTITMIPYSRYPSINFS